MGLDIQDISSWDQNPPNFTLDLVSYRSAILVTYVSSGIITHFVLAFVCLHFAPLDTRMPSSLEKLFITWVAAINSFTSVLIHQLIGLAGRGYANGQRDWGSIPDRVMPKMQNIVLDATLLNTQHYKVQIKSKVEHSRERSSTLLYSSV